MAGLVLSCAMTGCAISVQPDFCATARPIYVSKTDVFSDETARQVLAYNIAGKNLCGWKPTGNNP